MSFSARTVAPGFSPTVPCSPEKATQPAGEQLRLSIDSFGILAGKGQTFCEPKRCQTVEGPLLLGFGSTNSLGHPCWLHSSSSGSEQLVFTLPIASFDFVPLFSSRLYPWFLGCGQFPLVRVECEKLPCAQVQGRCDMKNIEAAMAIGDRMAGGKRLRALKYIMEFARREHGHTIGQVVRHICFTWPRVSNALVAKIVPEAEPAELLLLPPLPFWRAMSTPIPGDSPLLRRSTSSPGLEVLRRSNGEVMEASLSGEASLFSWLLFSFLSKR